MWARELVRVIERLKEDPEYYKARRDFHEACEKMAEAKLLPSDAYAFYEAGLNLLLDRRGRDHSLYSETLSSQHRLLENIRAAWLHGDTETRRVERSEVVSQLNELASYAPGLSLNEVCTQATSSRDLTPLTTWSTNLYVEFQRLEVKCLHILMS